MTYCLAFEKICSSKYCIVLHVYAMIRLKGAFQKVFEKYLGWKFMYRNPNHLKANQFNIKV